MMISAKYINTPQTIVYDKSRVLFGLDMAQYKIAELDMAIVTEGQFDCLSAHRAGITNVVAVSGTGFTPEHAEALRVFSNNISFAFDSDIAGQKALHRAADIAYKKGFNVYVIDVYPEKDLDELVFNDIRYLKMLCSNPTPIMKYYYNHILAVYNLRKKEEVKPALEIFIPLLRQFSKSNERKGWLKDFVSFFNGNVDLLESII